MQFGQVRRNKNETKCGGGTVASLAEGPSWRGGRTRHWWVYVTPPQNKKHVHTRLLQPRRNNSIAALCPVLTAAWALHCTCMPLSSAARRVVLAVSSTACVSMPAAVLVLVLVLVLCCAGTHTRTSSARIAVWGAGGKPCPASTLGGALPLPCARGLACAPKPYSCIASVGCEGDRARAREVSPPCAS